jgi:hypothetical protein
VFIVIAKNTYFFYDKIAKLPKMLDYSMEHYNIWGSHSSWTTLPVKIYIQTFNIQLSDFSEQLTTKSNSNVLWEN